MSRRSRGGRPGTSGVIRGGPPGPRRDTRHAPRQGEPSRLILVLGAVIVAAGTWAYWPSFGGAFVLDDIPAIVENTTIRTLWPLSVPLSPPSDSTVAGRPLANLSFAVSYAAGAAARPGAPPDAWAFHAGNLLIHLAAALALFGVVRRTLTSPALRARFEVSAPWLAAAVALVWAVHPLQTAAVTYVVQRVESLMGLFFLLTLYSAIRADGSSRARGWTAAAIASCACGMATKEVMVTAPVMVALWDWFFREPGPVGSGRVRWKLVASLATTWLMLGVLVFHEHRAGSVSFAPATAGAYLLTQAGVVVHYLRLAFVPSPLCLMYDWPMVGSAGAVAWQAALLVALVVATAIGVVRRHPAGFLGSWFFLILAPSSSLVPIVTEVAAEHRMYLSLAAIVAASATGAFLLGTRLLRDSRAGVAVAAAAVIVVAAALGGETRARNHVYSSADGLWQDTVDKRPSDFRTRIGYADMLERAGRPRDAEAQLRIAVELVPASPLANERLGSVLAQQHEIDASIPYFMAALAADPHYFYAHRLLADIYASRGRDGLAVQHYEQALATLPDDAAVTARIAAILADSRDAAVRNPARAVALARRAVTLTAGRDPGVIEILSVAEAASGRYADAAATARAGLALARAGSDRDLVAALEQRVSMYDAAATARDRLTPAR